MPIGITEIHTPATIPVVNFAVFWRAWSASVHQALFLDAPEDFIELFFANLESVVLTVEVCGCVEIQRECLAGNPDRCEVA